mgnify:CR=1 FL=1
MASFATFALKDRGFNARGAKGARGTLAPDGEAIILDKINRIYRMGREGPARGRRFETGRGILTQESLEAQKER